MDKQIVHRKTYMDKQIVHRKTNMDKEMVHRKTDMDKQYNILLARSSLWKYKTLTERYFTKRYILDVGGVKDNDIMIMFHSNRIALLCLAPTHNFFRNVKDFKINFTIGKVDRLTNAVKGKGKKGGQGLMPNSVICRIEYPDGSVFPVPCGMKSTLVEINEQLVKNPRLLREKHDADGFIAIILSSIAISEATKNELLTHEEYVFTKFDNCICLS